MGLVEWVREEQEGEGDKWGCGGWALGRECDDVALVAGV